MKKTNVVTANSVAQNYMPESDRNQINISTKNHINDADKRENQ